MSTTKSNIFSLSNIKKDLPASIVVFLVALPLCLGIALASGAPLFSGLIAGIVGGIIVGSASGSSLGVSGPAAGLAVIVLHAITDLGGFDVLLLAIVFAGILQVIMGFAKAGIIAYYFPSSVIHGMLAGIGILIFFKQIPHAFGYDKDFEGDQSFQQMDGENTFSELINMLGYINSGILLITAISLAILILWDSKWIKNQAYLKLIPGPLLAVITGIVLSQLLNSLPQFNIDSSHMVTLPIASNLTEFLGNFTFPDFSAISNPKVYTTAIVIAVVASLETLLCVEATDKLDPSKRITPTNRELKAQGIGNIISGLIGGLPVTQVIVRSSANIQSGGKSKLSTVLHGFLILTSIIFIPKLLNKIPLATLAAILLVVGYKLAKPAMFVKMYKQGKGQFLPFIVTIVGMLLSDLLIGVGLGLVVAVFIILRNNYKVPFILDQEENDQKKAFNITLSEDVTFLNKASLLKFLDQVPNDSSIKINASNSRFIHFDVFEIIENFIMSSKERNIYVEVQNLDQTKLKIPKQYFELTEN